MLLCFLAGRDVELEETELHAAIRRAELLLAAGGDPRRPLELYGRAVTALAADLDDPVSREQLAVGLDAPDRGDRRPARRRARPSGYSGATATSPGSATRWRSSPTRSPATSRRARQTPTARMMLRSPLIVRTRSSPTGAPASTGRRIVEPELRAHRAADRARIDIEALARLDRELDVARDGLHPDRVARRPPAPGRRPRRSSRRGRPTASSTWRSPETRFAESMPVGSGRATRLRRPCGGRTCLRRRARGRRRSRCRRPAARPSSTGRRPRPSSPRRRRAAGRLQVGRAGAERRDRCPSGQRTRTPTFGPRPSMRPDFRFRSTMISWPAAARGHLDAGLLDHLPRDVVVAQRDQLHVDTAARRGLDADLAAVEADAQEHGAGRVERHRVWSRPGLRRGLRGRRTTRTPSGRPRGGRESYGAGRSTLPKKVDEGT